MQQTAEFITKTAGFSNFCYLLFVICYLDDHQTFLEYQWWTTGSLVSAVKKILVGRPWYACVWVGN